MNPTATLQIATPTEREVVLKRTFDAPRRLVFDALTKPELLKRWYGPNGWTMVVCEIDLRVGGAWRFVTRRADGTEVGQNGVYREIVAPERIVNTEAWEDWNPGEVLVTTALVEHEGATTYTNTLLFPSQEVRDSLIASGMTSGAAESFDRFAEYLASVSDTGT
jgi:uncharacterized protein YndB with AHSA1/START domain